MLYYNYCFDNFEMIFVEIHFEYLLQCLHIIYKQTRFST